jgi:hypothetical protein
VNCNNAPTTPGTGGCGACTFKVCQPGCVASACMGGFQYFVYWCGNPAYTCPPGWVGVGTTCNGTCGCGKGGYVPPAEVCGWPGCY